MYFGPAVEGLFTVGASLLPLILRLKKKKERKEKYQPGGHFPNTTETRCSSSLTEATKHLAKGGDEMAVTLEMYHVDTGESAPPPHSLTVWLSNIEATDQEQSLS